MREGDGDRIIRYWRFLLPVFKLSDRRNYALEAFKLLAQVILLPPRQVAELKWGRTVNTVERTPMLQYIDWDLLSEWIKDKITDLDLKL